MKRMVVFAALVLLALSAVAQASGAIPNWAAPSTWTPPSAQAAGRSALVGLAVPLIPITPCRVIDTRAGSGFPAGYGPPSMAGGGTQRTFLISGQCGIPASVQAVSFNFTVWAPATRGDLRVFPAGTVAPAVSTLNWEAGILALANAAVVPVRFADGGITVQIDGASNVDIFVDVNGYYSQLPPLGFAIASTGSFGLYGRGANQGVFGISSAGIGVQGNSTSSNGVQGNSAAAGIAAVLGTNNNVASGTHGVGGFAGGTGAVFGVQGQIGSGAHPAAGVHGIGATVGATYGVFGQAGTANWVSPNVFVAGVRGIGSNGGSQGHGVLGEGVTIGVLGYRVNAAGAIQTQGQVGALAADGFFTPNNLTVSGTKSFVEPHPTDPSSVIKYVALEGPEAGTYFRGKGIFVGGHATIDVPDYFRMVTDTEGLTVQVTPIGRPTAVGVVSMGLDAIEVEATRDVEFSYLVQGVRRAFRDFKPIQSDSETLYFRPQTQDARLNPTFPEELRLRLIASGIYNPDGTVNKATAERMGWAQKWRDDEAKMKAAGEAASAQPK